MKGYPKVIATKADFDFLLADPEYKNRALADLKAVADLADDTMQKVVSYDLDGTGKMINVVTETVPAPLPVWKRLGFAAGENTAELYAVNAPVVIETPTKGGN